MSYKNLLVYLDQSRANTGRIAAATAIARAHDAHLSGVALAVEPTLPNYIWGQLPSEFREARQEEARRTAEDSAQGFRDTCQREGVKGEARVVPCQDLQAADVLSLHARHTDLVVFSQPDPEDNLALEQRYVEDVVFASGRPVLLVPYIGAGNSIGRRVVIAWDGGREATRAVNDALSFLQNADQVTVMVIDPESRPAVHGQEPGADIGLHLARHGVKVEVVRAQSDGIGIANLLLSRLSDRDADLLVMGGYGHSRLREMALGGVTRAILESMTVPVLMSH